MLLSMRNRYGRVQALMRWEDFVDNGVVLARWIDENCLWWTRHTETGREIRVANGSGRDLHAVTFVELARAISKELDDEVNADHVVLAGLEVTLDPLMVTFDRAVVPGPTTLRLRAPSSGPEPPVP